MKVLKYIILFCAGVAGSTAAFAQSSKQDKEAAIKKAIETRTYKFVAQYAQPQGSTLLNGTQRYLNYPYDVRVKPDSVIAYLPYFGTTQFAPTYNPTDDGIKFTSTQFDYQVKVKKNKYTITINLKDAGYNRRLIIFTSPSGYASMQVLITNRTPILFNGYITGINDKSDVTAYNRNQ